MTRIESFWIEGLAGRSERLSFKLEEDVNVFFGLNGTGKSSLLKILNSAMVGETASLRGLPFKRASVTFWSEDHETRITRTISSPPKTNPTEYAVLDDLHFLPGEQIEEGAWHTTPRSIDNRERFRLEYLSTTRIGGIEAMPSSMRIQGRQGMSERQLDELFAFHVGQTWRRSSSKLLSEVRSIQASGLADILSSVFAGEKASEGAQVDEETAYHRASEFLARQGTRLKGNRQSFRKRYAQDPRLRTVVSEIDQIERDIEHAEQPRRNLQMLIESFISNNKRIEFTDRDIVVTVGDGENIAVSALSSGEKQLVRIFLAAMNADSSTLIIDEPELSLHIDWQTELLGALRTLNETAQIIVATHSPEIMANLPDSKIHRL